MTKRTSLTPPLGIPTAGVHAMRRGGARREVSDRVSLRANDRTLEGWALNVSRGGVRVIVEDPVALGEVFEITLGTGDDTLTRSGRVVWIQEEPDGMVCGLAFVLAANEGPKTVPPPPPGSRTLP
ncbi:MAG TPA: PilZ domain-containing protein [Polyangiaceae bacterium]|nr:PilZ domain-containing protein [Polyangiaceae bacterium]